MNVQCWVRASAAGRCIMNVRRGIAKAIMLRLVHLDVKIPYWRSLQKGAPELNAPLLLALWCCIDVVCFQDSAPGVCGCWSCRGIRSGRLHALLPVAPARLLPHAGGGRAQGTEATVSALAAIPSFLLRAAPAVQRLTPLPLPAWGCVGLWLLGSAP